jgi:hypothetical protein
MRCLVFSEIRPLPRMAFDTVTFEIFRRRAIVSRVTAMAPAKEIDPPDGSQIPNLINE